MLCPEACNKTKWRDHCKNKVICYIIFPCSCPADLILWSYLWGVCWGGFMQTHKSSGKKISGPEVFNLLNIQDTTEESKERWGSCFYTMLFCTFVCLLYRCSVLRGLQQPTLSQNWLLYPQACTAHGDLQREKKCKYLNSQFKSPRKSNWTIYFGKEQ